MSKQYVSNEIIPNYIIKASVYYNPAILPIFLYIKRRTNKQGECYFNFKSMLSYFKDDSYITSKKEEVLEALMFLLIGGEKFTVSGDKTVDIFEYSNSYELDESSTILIKLSKMMDVKIADDEDIVRPLRIVSNDKRIPTETILKRLAKELEEQTEILLYDLTLQDTSQYTLIESETLQYLFWYYTTQNQSVKDTINILRTKENYRLKDADKLKELKKKYQIIESSKISPISFTTLINLYLYIFHLYKYNKNLKQSTYISTAKISKLLNISNSTSTLYVSILQDMKLLHTKKGSFKSKQATSYIISEDWKKDYSYFNTLGVFFYSVVTKEQLKELKSCYGEVRTKATSSKSTSKPKGRPKKSFTAEDFDW